MTKKLLYLLLAILVFNSCKKDTDEPNPTDAPTKFSLEFNQPISYVTGTTYALIHDREGILIDYKNITGLETFAMEVQSPNSDYTLSYCNVDAEGDVDIKTTFRMKASSLTQNPPMQAPPLNTFKLYLDELDYNYGDINFSSKYHFSSTIDYSAIMDNASISFMSRCEGTDFLLFDDYYENYYYLTDLKPSIYYMGYNLNNLIEYSCSQADVNIKAVEGAMESEFTLTGIKDGSIYGDYPKIFKRELYESGYSWDNQISISYPAGIFNSYMSRLTGYGPSNSTVWESQKIGSIPTEISEPNINISYEGYILEDFSFTVQGEYDYCRGRFYGNSGGQLLSWEIYAPGDIRYLPVLELPAEILANYTLSFNNLQMYDLSAVSCDAVTDYSQFFSTNWIDAEEQLMLRYDAYTFLQRMVLISPVFKKELEHLVK